MVQPPFHVYVDVAGTDRSGIVISLPKATRPLSDVGECDIILSNKAGAYKAAFSEMQRVAVSSARAAFASTASDYFTGTDGAAPNARWTTICSGAGTATIDGNKLKCTITNAGDTGGVKSVAPQTIPIVLRVWVKSNSVHEWSINIGFHDGVDIHVQLCVVSGSWNLYTRQGGALASRDSSASFTVDTWYFCKVVLSDSTHVAVNVYDVFGASVWSSSSTMDAITSSEVRLWNYSWDAASETTYFDSVLVTSSASVVADQLFEGVVNSVEFNAPPDTITLHCVDDAIELERQIDDTYGAATATIAPTYGATEDFAAAVSLMLPTGWTYTIPDMAWHDNLRVQVNTRRLTVIQNLINVSGYLGFYVLPMKHIVFVAPTNGSIPDTYTEATTGWTASGCTIATNATPVDGAQLLKLTSNGAAGLKTAYHAVNVNPTTYRFIDFYCGNGPAGGTPKVRLYTDTVTPKYWEYSLYQIQTVLTPAANELGHCRLCLPGSEGLHGWTNSASAPTIGDTITRLEFEFNDPIGATLYFYFDTVFFHAEKNTASKYTVSNLIGANRTISKPRCYSSFQVLTNWGTITITDATLAAISGTRDYSWSDYGITLEQQSLSSTYCLLAKQAYNIGGEPISAQVVNPSDMYNVMPGDTLTITITNMDLAAVTRILGSRTDSIIEVGWRTTLILVAIPPTNPVSELWEIVSKKRFT